MLNKISAPVIRVMLGAAVLAGCAPTPDPAVSRLSATPVLDGGRYTSGGGITVAADIRQHDGRTLVCGVWALSAQQSALTSLAERQVLGSGSVFLGKERIVHGLLFMQQTEAADQYGGQDAKCVLTHRLWQAADADKPLRIRIPRQVVANELDDEGGGTIVWFKQTGPEA